MKNKMPRVFWITLCIVIVTLGGLCIYFALNCSEIAKFHIEPQLDAAVLQALAGVVLVIVFSSLKYYRNNKIWFVLPLLFIAFAVLDYFTIVGCPICA